MAVRTSSVSRQWKARQRNSRGLPDRQGLSGRPIFGIIRLWLRAYTATGVIQRGSALSALSALSTTASTKATPFNPS